MLIAAYDQGSAKFRELWCLSKKKITHLFDTWRLHETRSTHHQRVLNWTLDAQS